MSKSPQTPSIVITHDFIDFGLKAAAVANKLCPAPLSRYALNTHDGPVGEDINKAVVEEPADSGHQFFLGRCLGVRTRFVASTGTAEGKIVFLVVASYVATPQLRLRGNRGVFPHTISA